MDELIYWIWFSLQVQANNKAARELFLKVKSPKIIYYMKEKDLRQFSFLNDYTVFKLLNKDIDEPKKIIETCVKNNYNIICFDDPDYPARLKEIDDFPYLLYHRGHKFNFTDTLAIAIVGTRKPSLYGIDICKRLSRDLAVNKALIISGMAYGIDAAAHLGAMSVDKPTVAVLGTGIDIISPKENKNLYDYMVSDGAIYSEYAPGTKGWPQNYPQRNRIISGLSVGVLVIEAESKSGSLITADYALKQGKDVFAVPNSINNVKGDGTNKLIKEGAILTTSVFDILNEYKDLYIEENDIKEFDEKEFSNKFIVEDFLSGFDDLTPLEAEISKYMDIKLKTVDEISESSKIPIQNILSAMTMLEIKGVVKSELGSRFRLNIN